MFFCNTANTSHLLFPISGGWFEFCKYSKRFTQGAYHKKWTELTCSVSNTVHMSSYYLNIFWLAAWEMPVSKMKVSQSRKETGKKPRFTLAHLSVETRRHWTAACIGSCLVRHTGCFLPVSVLRTNIFARACRTAMISISSHAAVCTQG